MCAILMLWISGCSTEPVPSYHLDVISEPEEGGIVTPVGGDFQEGKSVQLTATPNEGWIFTGWEGNLTGDNNPETLQIASNAWVRAVFEKRNYPLTLTVEGNGTIHEKVVQGKTVDHPHGTVVELQPVPETGWRFSHWGGGVLSGNETPAEITIDGPVSVTATFVPIEGSIITFGGTRTDVSFSITETSDGGFAMTGYSQSNDGDFEGQFNDDFDLMIIKVGSDGNKEWARLFGDAELNQGYSITSTTDGGIVVSGKYFTGSWTTHVMKLDLNGNVLWKRQFKESSGEAVTATADGGVVVTGFNASNEGIFEGLHRGETDVFLLKLNADGEVAWVQNFGGSSGDVGRSVVQMADGGFLVSGWAYSTDGTFEGLKDHNNMAGFLIRTDQEGELKWARFKSERDEIYVLKSESPDVAESTGGKIIYIYTDLTSGETLGSTLGRYHILEVDRDGETIWKKTFNGSGSDDIYGIEATDDGGVILTGFTGSEDGDFAGLELNGRTDILIHKLSSMGDTEWMKNYGGSQGENGTSIIQRSSGGYAITGNFWSNDADFQGMLRDGSDIFIMFTDENGELYSKW